MASAGFIATNNDVGDRVINCSIQHFSSSINVQLPSSLIAHGRAAEENVEKASKRHVTHLAKSLTCVRGDDGLSIRTACLATFRIKCIEDTLQVLVRPVETPRTTPKRPLRGLDRLEEDAAGLQISVDPLARS